MNNLPQSKQQRLREKLQIFQASERKAGDYLLLFYVVRDVTNQGSGLLWTEILDILREEIVETK